MTRMSEIEIGLQISITELHGGRGYTAEPKCALRNTLEGLYQDRIVTSERRSVERREHEACTDASGMRLCCNGVTMARVARDYGADPREL